MASDVEMAEILPQNENGSGMDLEVSTIQDDACLIHENTHASTNSDENDTTVYPDEATGEIEHDPETGRPCRPTKIVLLKSVDELEIEVKDQLSPITVNGRMLKNKVGISDDGNKRIVKLARAFYYFPREFNSFSENEIVIAKLSDKQTMYKVFSLKNLGDSLEVPRHRAVALTPNIWKYGVKNKHFVPANFIQDLIAANRPELIELAYLQLPVLDTNIPNPFNANEKRKKPVNRHESILHMCARSGSPTSMQYLLENLSPSFPFTIQSNMFSRGDSILQAAIESSRLEMVEVILDYATRDEQEAEPIRSRSGLLLRRFRPRKRSSDATDINKPPSNDLRSQILDKKNDFTETPLHVCLRKDNFECLKLLIRFNASLEVKDKYGNTVVHTAALRNKVDGLNEMLSVFEESEDRMADWQQVLRLGNKKNLVPAALATEIPVVEVLLKRADKDENFDDELGHLLFWAAGRNNLELARYLIEQGASVNVENENGQTPLKLACVRGHVDLAELILDHNKDPNYTGRHSGLTAMNSAAKSGHLDVVELLRKHKVHLWDQGVMETSALHSAISGGQSQLAEYV